MKREIEHRWRDLGQFVREQRRLGQMSLRRLSELSGVSNPYLSQIERGLRRPSAEILQQLARALQISAETLYVRAGILDPHPEEADLMASIRRDPVLTEPQKRTLIHIYESFRAEALAAQAEAHAAGSEDHSQPSEPSGEASEADSEDRSAGEPAGNAAVGEEGPVASPSPVGVLRFDAEQATAERG